MPSFLYKGINAQGRHISSIITASKKADAIYQLMESGVDVLSIKKASVARKFRSFKLNQKDMISFFVHVSEMAHAGMNTTQSLDLLIDLADSKRLLEVAKAIKSRVNEGSNLADAMAAVGTFGDMFPNLIFVAEKTNALHKVGNMIVDYIKWTEQMRKQIKSAVLRPVISLGFIIVLMLGMSIFVLPKLIETLSQFTNGALPSYTQSFINFANFIRQDWYVLALVIGSIYSIGAVPRILKLKTMIQLVDRCKLKMPIFGKLFLKIEIARLSAFLSILINAGYKANDAIMMAPRVIINRYIKQIVEDVGVVMSSGETIHTAFSKFSVFPKFFVSMIGIGEAVNDIEGTIMNIKESYDKEVASSVEFVISSVKPIVTIVTGVIVGWMGMAVFGPMYSSVTNLSNTLK